LFESCLSENLGESQMLKQCFELNLLRRKVILGLLVIGSACWGSNLRADTVADFAALFPQSVPLNPSSSGSYTVMATVGGVGTEFLLDTGASMTTVSASLFNKIREHEEVIKVRRVGARLASGKVEVLDVYLVQHFSLGGGCELGPLEIAVLNKGGRNLLGMNVLQEAAPFAVSLTPPALGLSRCGSSASQISLRD
jgi:hypothetical protein